MNKEIKTTLKKTVKIAGVTCIALGGAALIASGAALKAVTEGGRYLKDAVKKIVDEKPEAEIVEEAPASEAVAEEADFAEAESREV